MASNSRDTQESDCDEHCDCCVPPCGSMLAAAHHERVRGGLPRAGSFSNLDETEEEAPLSFPRDINISSKIEELSSSDVNVVASAAEYLFEKAHSSNPKSEQNKIQMGRDGAIPALSLLLDSEDDNIRYQSLSAISEIAFRDSWNCNEIAHTPGLLERLAELLHPDAGLTQEDAALVINNCAAFCEEAVPRIVSCSGMLSALTLLAAGGDAPSRNIAIGALNSFSRCEACREHLLRPDVLAALWSALADDPTAPADAAESERRDARRVRAAMAIANLTGPDAPVADAAHPACPDGAAARLAAAVARAVEILDLSVAGRSWAGVFFAPYSVLYPLARLALHPANAALLLDSGVAPRLAGFLAAWRAGPRPERALALALAAAASLSAAGEAARRPLRAAGLVAALRTLAAPPCAPDAAPAVPAVPAECRAAAGRLAGELEGAHWAVWMAAHARLGAGSALGGLDSDVLHIIARQAVVG